MKVVNSFAQFDQNIEMLNKQGAFLTVKDRNGIINTMTISWALFGIMWLDPICMVAVRPSRYTFQLIENAEDFTVTIPFDDMKKQLIYCGSHSGNKVDKFKECELTTVTTKSVVSPIIKIKNARHYACKIVQRTVMDKFRLNLLYDKNLYQDQAYHTYYFGEIVECYET